MICEAMYLQSVIKIVTLHTFFLSTFMSFGMLLSNRKNAKNQIFFGLFLAFSLMIFYFFLYESKLVETHPYLAVLCIPAVFLIGPMVYFLAWYSVNKAFEFTKKRYWHLMPAFISLVIGILGVYSYGYEHLSVYFNFYGNKIVLVLGALGTLSFTFYLILTGRVLLKSYLWHLNTIKNEPSALASFIIFDIFMAASITDTLALFTGHYIFLQLSVLLVSVCVVILFLLNLIYPSFNKIIGDVVTNEKKRRSYLSNIDTERLKDKIFELIQTKEVFTDEHLTLEKLASQATVSSHQLSEFINEYNNKNFTTFINEFRVEKAKELLIKNSGYTVLAVAYDVGFNSKSVFNKAFRDVTGLTPSQFRSMNQDKNKS